jgi:rhodanese-related sulfurtransferase
VAIAQAARATEGAAADSNGHSRPGPARLTVDAMLAAARRGLVRLTAKQALAAAEDRGAILVDTRSEDQRQAQGYLRSARSIPLSVLEWRMDPSSGYADEDVTLDSWIVLICREGYSSSLAAARLQTLGFARATDVIDGVDGWKAAGLPLSPRAP